MFFGLKCQHIEAIKGHEHVPGDQGHVGEVVDVVSVQGSAGQDDYPIYIYLVFKM